MLAAQQILLTASDMLFSVPIAFMIATSVMVGQYFKNHPQQTKQFSRYCEVIMAIFMIIGGGLLWQFGEVWTVEYNEEILLIEMMLAALIAMCSKNTIEGVQSLMAFNLRAIDKGWYVVIINGLSLWIIGVGGIWALHYFEMMTLENIWWVLASAYLVAWILLRISFFRQFDRQTI